MSTLMNESTAPELAEQDAPRKAFRGLLWREWLLYSRTIYGFLAVWLIGIWVLQVFNHPAWIAVFGCAFAFALAAAMGGGDAAEGSEEFAFSLPVSRGEHFRARATLGLACLAFFLVAGLIAVAWNLPQLLWGLFVETGFTWPNARVANPRPIYAITILLPMALFCCNFSLAAVWAASPRGMGNANNIGMIATLAITGAAFFAEYKVWNQPTFTERITVPTLAVWAALTFGGGYLLYVRKEAASRLTASDAGRPDPLRLIPGILIVVVLALLLSMCISFTRSS